MGYVCRGPTVMRPSPTGPTNTHAAEVSCQSPLNPHYLGQIRTPPPPPPPPLVFALWFSSLIWFPLIHFILITSYSFSFSFFIFIFLTSVLSLHLAKQKERKKYTSPPPPPPPPPKKKKVRRSSTVIIQLLNL